MSPSSKEAPRNKLELAEAAFASAVAEACVGGFYGTASVVLSVQDGHIQHVKVAIERMIR